MNTQGKPRIRQNIYGQWKAYLGDRLECIFHDGTGQYGRTAELQARERLQNKLNERRTNKVSPS